MRVCSPQLGLSPEATLGGEVYDREILTRLADLGVQLEVILPAGLPCSQAANLRFTRVPLRRGYRWFVSNWIFPWHIGQVYRRRPFDLLRVHSLRFTGPAALASRRLFHLPVPVVAHHHHLDRDRWTDHLERRVVQRCDWIITGSQFARQQLHSELDVPPERVRVVHYGVSRAYRPLPRDEVLAQRLGLENRPVLLYVGSLKERKNLPVLLHALRLVLEEQKGVVLLLVGRGESEPALHRLAQDLGLGDSVHFAGFVPEGEKVAWYNLANVFVIPSLMEGFGLAPAEAMACGKPVVASRAGSLPEVVADGETGILCDSNDPGEFAGAIQRLLDSPSVAETMGRAGRRRVEQLFRWERSALRTLQVYEEAVQSWQA
jgi:glycosyltransferase involved in cell wall biosynthesis